MENSTADLKKKKEKKKEQAGLNMLVKAVLVKPCGHFRVQRGGDVQSGNGKSVLGGLRGEGERRK